MLRIKKHEELKIKSMLNSKNYGIIKEKDLETLPAYTNTPSKKVSLEWDSFIRS